MAVLVQGVTGQAAYHAIVRKPVDRSEEIAVAHTVATRGAKLPYEEAVKHWPTIHRGDYRS